jgi:hypothetical protein
MSSGATLESREATPQAPGAHLSRAASIAFFVVVLFHFSHPLADGDLWWHLNTGRWIISHRALPQSDPFTYTVSPPFSGRARMFVRSNWLAEITYYAVYSLLGLNGLRGFNAVLFTLITFVVYRTMRLRCVGVWWSLLLTSPCAAMAWYYDELRPLGFSVLLVALFLHVVARAEERGKGRAREWPWAKLLLLAVVWANVHRGFPLIYLLLAPYVAVGLWHARWREAFGFVSVGAAALLNPSGIAPLISALSESFQGTGSFHILELARPWEFARLVGEGSSYAALLALVVVGSLLVMGFDWHRLEPEHVLLFAAFLVAGLTAFRYSIYLTVVAAATCAPSAGRLFGGTRIAELWRAPALGVAGVMGALLFSSARPTTQAAYVAGLPLRAVSAIVQYQLAGPIFNPYDWGGYLSWVTWPRYRVFTDSRLLDYSVLEKIEDGERTSFAPLLAEYGINTVLFPPSDVQTARSRRIVRELMGNPAWKLVFFDPVATVFVRRSAAPDVPEASEQELGGYLLSIVSYRMRGRRPVPEDEFEAAAILRAMGREEQAREADDRGFATLKGSPQAPSAPHEPPASLGRP